MQVFSNYAQTYIVPGITDTATTIVVATTTGGLFTDPEAHEYELLVLTDGTYWEVVKMLSRLGDSLTVERGHEGVARAWGSGITIKNSITKATMDNMLQDDSIGAAIRLYAYHNFR